MQLQKGRHRPPLLLVIPLHKIAVADGTIRQKIAQIILGTRTQGLLAFGYVIKSMHEREWQAGRKIIPIPVTMQFSSQNKL